MQRLPLRIRQVAPLSWRLSCSTLPGPQACRPMQPKVCYPELPCEHVPLLVGGELLFSVGFEEQQLVLEAVWSCQLYITWAVPHPMACSPRPMALSAGLTCLVGSSCCRAKAQCHSCSLLKQGVTGLCACRASAKCYSCSLLRQGVTGLCACRAGGAGG